MPFLKIVVTYPIFHSSDKVDDSSDFVNIIYVTGFWITDRIVTLGLIHLMAQLMAMLVHYTYTVPLAGLVDWSAFLERVLPTL